MQRLALLAKVSRTFKISRSSVGSRPIKTMLNGAGIEIGRFKVSRLMAELGLICKQLGPHAYKQATVERLDIPNILDRHFNLDDVNQVCCGDISYIWAGTHCSYQAVVLDFFARRVVGWTLSDRRDADLTIKALEHAYEQRGKPDGILFHSDQDSHYGSLRFRQRLWRYQFRQSMRRRGNCWDNAPVERLFRSLKTARVPAMGYQVMAEARKDTGLYLMDDYNWQRRHTANDGMAPAVAEEKLNLLYGIS